MMKFLCVASFHFFLHLSTATATVADAEVDETCALQLRGGGVAAKPDYCAHQANVSCPGSGKMCTGNQCCPAVSGNLTFPCPSADDQFAGCDNNTKVESCLKPREPCASEVLQGCGARRWAGLLTLECLACDAAVTEERYCEEHLEATVCEKLA